MYRYWVWTAIVWLEGRVERDQTDTEGCARGGTLVNSHNFGLKFACNDNVLLVQVANVRKIRRIGWIGSNFLNE